MEWMEIIGRLISDETLYLDVCIMDVPRDEWSISGRLYSMTVRSVNVLMQNSFEQLVKDLQKWKEAGIPGGACCQHPEPEQCPWRLRILQEYELNSFYTDDRGLGQMPKPGDDDGD